MSCDVMCHVTCVMLHAPEDEPLAKKVKTENVKEESDDVSDTGGAMCVHVWRSAGVEWA